MTDRACWKDLNAKKKVAIDRLRAAMVVETLQAASAMNGDEDDAVEEVVFGVDSPPPPPTTNNNVEADAARLKTSTAKSAKNSTIIPQEERERPAVSPTRASSIYSGTFPADIAADSTESPSASTTASRPRLNPSQVEALRMENPELLQGIDDYLDACDEEAEAIKQQLSRFRRAVQKANDAIGSLLADTVEENDEAHLQMSRLHDAKKEIADVIAWLPEAKSLSRETTSSDGQNLTTNPIRDCIDNKDLLREIVSFLEPNHAALVKLFRQHAEDVATDTLRRIQQDNHLGDDWWLRLEDHVQACKQSFYSETNNAAVVPTPPPPRILLQAAKQLPVAQLETEHSGPTALIPNGNIAMACKRDNLIRIFDANGPIRIVLCEGPGGAQHQHGGFDRFFQIRLFYSAGHLVSEMGRTVIVWKLEGIDSESGQGTIRTIRFLYHKENVTGSFIVGRNGKMFTLREESEGDKIDVYQVSTGALLQTKEIEVQHDSKISCELQVSDNHLFLLRSIEHGYPREFPGLGVYVWNTEENNLSETSYLPCFQDFPVFLPRPHDSQSANHRILYQSTLSAVDRKFHIISFVEGILREETNGGAVTFDGDRFWPCGIASFNNVIVYDDDVDGRLLTMDEFDIVANTKVRSLCTGIQNGDVEHGQCTDKAVFCVLSRRSGGTYRTFIQRFLR